MLSNRRKVNNDFLQVFSFNELAAPISHSRAWLGLPPLVEAFDWLTKYTYIHTCMVYCICLSLMLVRLASARHLLATVGRHGSCNGAEASICSACYLKVGRMY